MVGGNFTASNFLITVTANDATPSVFPGSENGVMVSLPTGNYIISENTTLTGNYIQNFSTTCHGFITAGQSITCRITNTFVVPVYNGIVTTRTQGFWATHTAFTEWAFSNVLNGSMQIGTAPHKGVLTANSEVLGAFEAGISKNSTKVKRTQINQSRMQLLQQLVAAKLNCAAFGCNVTGVSLISSADNVYASTNASQMNLLTSELDAFNNAGEKSVLPSNVPNSGSATPSDSKSIANVIFWDNP